MMFNKKENKKYPEKQVMERNILGKNTTIVGDINSEGDFRIDGSLEGTLKIKGHVMIGSEGNIKGTVNCTNMDIEGKFSGELRASNTLTIKSTAIISGDIIVGKLSVEPGASLNVSCSMKGAVKEFNKNEHKKESKKIT